MRYVTLAACLLLLLSGCARRPLYMPDAHVWPETIGFNGLISVRVYGAEIARYRFMGANPAPNGFWQVRLDPAYFPWRFQPAHITVHPGQVVPLGRTPSVWVRFVKISSTRLVLRAEGIHRLKDPF